MNKFDFTSNNGDKLRDLNDRLKAAVALSDELRKCAADKREKLAAVERDLEQAHQESMNISTRLNIWWNEYRASHGPRRKGHYSTRK